MIHFYYVKCTLDSVVQFQFFFFIYSYSILLKIAQFHYIATKLAKTPQICKFFDQNSFLLENRLVAQHAHDFFSVAKERERRAL